MKLRIDYKKSFEGMWNWLADNPEKEKRDWPGLKTVNRFLDENILSLSAPFNFERTYCFACQSVATNGIVDGFSCSICPVYFGVVGECWQTYSYYDRWNRAQTNKTRTKYARLIAKGWKAATI